MDVRLKATGEKIGETNGQCVVGAHRTFEQNGQWQGRKEAVFALGYALGPSAENPGLLVGAACLLVDSEAEALVLPGYRPVRATIGALSGRAGAGIPEEMNQVVVPGRKK